MEKEKIKIFYSKYEPQNINEFYNKSIVAFAGIGIPSNFYESLTTYGINIIKFMDFPDHHLYDDSEIKKIKDQYPTFCGIFDWEYLNAPPDTNDPSQWAKLIKNC